MSLKESLDRISQAETLAESTEHIPSVRMEEYRALLIEMLDSCLSGNGHAVLLVALDTSGDRQQAAAMSVNASLADVARLVTAAQEQVAAHAAAALRDALSPDRVLN